MSRRSLRLTFGGFAAVLISLQLVPLRVENPPVVQEPDWDDPLTRTLAERACFDCHSNETDLPLYGRLAPVSWFLWDHVREGRAKLNLSEMNRFQEEGDEAGEEVLEGEMPPRSYLLMHPDARLSPDERRILAAGLDASLGGASRTLVPHNEETGESEEHRGDGAELD